MPQVFNRLAQAVALRALVVALLLMSSGDAIRAVAQDRLLVGVAEANITPPPGFPMAGYYHERLAEGVIDPLKAKAIVFQYGDQRAAMVMCDLTGISRDLTNVVRARASDKTGIPTNFIAISGTHSHTAPDYSKQLYLYLKDLNSTEKKADGPQPAYPEMLIAGIVQAIVDAHGKLEPTIVSSGSAGQDVAVSFNRRFVMKNGSVQTWKSLADPEVVKPAGPIDPEVGVVLFSSETGTVRSVLSNFALHLDTVGGLRWSADYPYFIEQSVRKRYSQDVISVFGTGCCGDINHSDPSRKERNKTDFIGNAIADTIESVIPEVKRLTNDKLQVRSTVVNLPLQNVSDEQLERSRQLLKLVQSGGKVEFLDQVAAYKTVMLAQFRTASHRDDAEQQISWGLSHAWGGIGDSLPVDVQTICLGKELAIVFLPGEVFVDLGLAIKQGSPFRHTLIIELSNCVETAYIPTQAACVGGSYEVINSTVKPGAGELLVEAALQLLRESASSK